MSDSIDFKVNVAQAQSSLKSLDSTLQGTGKAIEGVKSTMEKIFAAQAIYASASRVADAIERVTEMLEDQTTAMQNVIQANVGGAKSFDKLASAAANARAEAAKINKAVEKYEPILNIAESGANLAKYLTPYGQVIEKVVGKVREEVNLQKEMAEGLSREAKLAEDKLTAQKESVSQAKQEAELLEKQNKFLDYAGKKYQERHSLNAIQPSQGEKLGAVLFNPYLNTGFTGGMNAHGNVADNSMNARNTPSRMATAFARAQGGIRGGIGKNRTGLFDSILSDADQRTADEAAQVQNMLDALAQTSPGQQIGGAREARRAQTLAARAAEADALGNTYDAGKLRERADRANARAAERLDRNEARSLRQQALDERRGIGRDGDISGPLQRAKELEAKANELEKAGSTKKTQGAGAKTMTDVWSVLNDRLPAKTS